MTSLAPIAVPRLCAGEAPVRGAFGLELEDFVVEEQLAYAPSGEGTHAFLWIEKRGIPTRGAIQRLARFLDLSTHAFGAAGMKDARAVTRQWLSIEHVDPERLRGWTVEGVRVLRAERHPHKVRIGHATGNRFRVRLRGVPPADREHARRILDRVARTGLPNAYGPQRFGRGGSSLRRGMALLRRDWSEFGGERAAAAIARGIRSLYLSAVQAEGFNRVLAKRFDDLATVRAGDVAFLHANGASFVVDDEPAEQARAARFEISASGPIVGTRLLRGGGAPRAVEDEVLAAMELSPESFLDLPFGHEARGARRPFRVPVGDLRADDDGDDLLLEFSLPAGSFATQVVREILGDPQPEASGDPIEES